MTITMDYTELFDTRGTLKCVRFPSRNVGVVNAEGKRLLELGPLQRLEFATHGFLKVKDRIEFFVDMKNGEIYAQMPEFIRWGDFELASIAGALCTRTRALYEVMAHPSEVRLGQRGLYLTLPYRGKPAEDILWKMIRRPARYEVCLLNGDESGVYWFMGEIDDHGLLVMNNGGCYYQVRRDVQTGKAWKEPLGSVRSQTSKGRIWQVAARISGQTGH